MDNFTKKHLRNWVKYKYENEATRKEVEELLTAFVDKYPEYVENNYSWPEMLVLAENEKGVNHAKMSSM